MRRETDVPEDGLLAAAKVESTITLGSERAPVARILVDVGGVLTERTVTIGPADDVSALDAMTEEERDAALAAVVAAAEARTVALARSRASTVASLARLFPEPQKPAEDPGIPANPAIAPDIPPL